MAKMGTKTNNRGDKSLLWILVLLSVALFTIPYLVPHTGLLALFSFVPLFYIDKICRESNIKRCWIFYSAVFLLWNLFSTYWIYKATVAGAIAAVILNSLQMIVVFRLFRWSKGVAKGAFPYIFFIALWLAWEHFYFDAEISWPWLTLGNAFAGSVRLIQWYDLTGTLGGSLWVLLTGTLLFRAMELGYLRRPKLNNIYYHNRLERRRRGFWNILLISIVVLPVGVSFIQYYTYKEKPDPIEIAVLQPNIDPYEDKFINLSREDQDNILLNLAGEAVSDTTLFVIAPETFTYHVFESSLTENTTIKRLIDFNREHPSVNFITGAITVKQYSPSALPPTETARRNGNVWFDTYNASIIVDKDANWDLFYKSKLVVLTEFVPYPGLLKHINKLAIELGGTTGSYGTQPEITIFTANEGTKIGTAICYESVYGDYYRDYILKGAQVMSIITNDGWWGNTPGYHQHLRYASLRAIETRRSIARSANTGISAFINQRGDIIAETEWWQPAYLTQSINKNNKLTFFVKNGDIIGRFSTFLMLLMLLASIVMRITKGKVNNR